MFASAEDNLDEAVVKVTRVKLCFFFFLFLWFNSKKALLTFIWQHLYLLEYSMWINTEQDKGIH